MRESVTAVLQAAILHAKRRRSAEVEPDDILAACLFSISRFGIARVGALVLDLERLGLDWISAAEPVDSEAKPAYSAASVALLDAAAAVARADHAKQPALEHLLAAFTRVPATPLWARVDIEGAVWRAALAAWEPAKQEAPAAADSYLSPEQAAEFLGVHHQTIRGYIRTGKLAALRIAGERAVRIRRESLHELMEPLTIN